MMLKFNLHKYLWHPRECRGNFVMRYLSLLICLLLSITIVSDFIQGIIQKYMYVYFINNIRYLEGRHFRGSYI